MRRFLSIDSTEAIEQQLADVGECDGVAARNAFQSDLPNQGAKKTVDCGGVSEIGAASKELLCGFADALVLQAALVVGAEGFIGRLDQHPAAPSLRIYVLAEGRFVLGCLGLWLEDEVGSRGTIRVWHRTRCFGS
jgi:hypothetical protein